jgi:hypothetical protein
MSEDPANTDPEARRLRQRGRNRALGLVLLFMVVLFFAITIVRLGQNVG